MNGHTVWIVLEREYYHGAEVDSVYATREAAQERADLLNKPGPHRWPGQSFEVVGFEVRDGQPQ